MAPLRCQRCGIELLAKFASDPICAHCRASRAEEKWIIAVLVVTSTLLGAAALFQWLGVVH